VSPFQQFGDAPHGFGMAAQVAGRKQLRRRAAIAGARSMFDLAACAPTSVAATKRKGRQQKGMPRQLWRPLAGLVYYGIMMSFVETQLLRHPQLYSGKKKGSLIEPFSSDWLLIHSSCSIHDFLGNPVHEVAEFLRIHAGAGICRSTIVIAR
jgi:hypothetical protein